MTDAEQEAVVYDAARLMRLVNDDPGIARFETVNQTLPLVKGARGKVRALFMAGLRLLPCEDTQRMVLPCDFSANDLVH